MPLDDLQLRKPDAGLAGSRAVVRPSSREPRFANIVEAARYVGVSVSTFREEVERGIWPPGMRRGRKGRAVTWDVRALDASADRLAGLVSATAGSSAIAEGSCKRDQETVLERIRGGAAKTARDLKSRPAAR